MISGYILNEVIGKGGMGCVYHGVTPEGKEAAIKMLDCQFVFNPDFREFFDIEAKALKEMNHPSVVKIMGNPFTDEKGNLYLPMEYIDGDTIEKYVKKNGPYSENAARNIMCKILDAFTYIHGQSKIHRDIKPSNIMIRKDGSICIIDFGIAKDMKTPTGKTIGRCVGTDGYMSPEQVNGNSIDYRTDIYSLGCLLHYIVTGNHAITKQSNDYKTIAVILNDEFPSAKKIRPELSDDIQQIIYKAVDKDMRKRFQTADSFKNAINGDYDNATATTALNGASITVGRNPNCDITFENEYVSGKHLTIYYKDNTMHKAFIEIVDHSTNGTGVNGRYVHNTSMIIQYDIYATHAQEIPSIMLAGREELSLDFMEVTKLLKSKDGQHSTQESTKIPSSFLSNTVLKDSLGIGYGILSFLFPIAGWYLWGKWGKDKPNSAKQAAIIAWGSFILGIILLSAIN